MLIGVPEMQVRLFTPIEAWHLPIMFSPAAQPQHSPHVGRLGIDNQQQRMNIYEALLDLSYGLAVKQNAQALSRLWRASGRSYLDMPSRQVIVLCGGTLWLCSASTS